MCVQIVLGFIWAAANISSVPGFGDSAEYLQLSENLKVDEYRTIFYPLLLKIANFMQRHTGISYFYYIYALQVVLCFVAIFYMWHFLYTRILGRNGMIKEIIVSLYLMTIPMVMGHNLTILTDSIALSALLVAITQLVRIPTEDKRWNYVVFFVAVTLELMIRADRIYSFTIYVAVYTVIYLIKTKNYKKYLLVLCCMLLAVVINLGINKKTQIKGYYGRIETNLSFVLLDRVVYPHMQQNYGDFPAEITDVVSIEDAQVFDTHNNNTMYVFAPMLQEKVGKDKAEEMYREMAAVVWRNNKKDVMREIWDKFKVMCFAPYYADASMKGKVISNWGWIYYNYSLNGEKLTGNYYNYYNIGYGIIGLVLTIVLLIYGLVRKSTRADMARWLKALTPYLVMLILLCLWFAVGDGDAANHRYVLIGYIMWTVLTIGTVSVTLAPAPSES